MLMGIDWTGKTRALAVLWKWLISCWGLYHFWQFLDFDPSKLRQLEWPATFSHQLITDWHCCIEWFLLVYYYSCGLFGWSSCACFWYKRLLPGNPHWWNREAWRCTLWYFSTRRGCYFFVILLSSCTRAFGTQVIIMDDNETFKGTWNSL